MASTSTSSISEATTTTTTVNASSTSTAASDTNPSNNSPTSSSNSSNTTSSSDKTKLSTSSTARNESHNLNNSTSEQVPMPTPTLPTSTTPASSVSSIALVTKDGDDENVDDFVNSDVDTLTPGLMETEETENNKNLPEASNKNQTHLTDSKNDPDEDLNEFSSSSLSISTLSTASSSGGDFNKPVHGVIGSTTSTTTVTSCTTSAANNIKNPNHPICSSTSSRKREHNRRKSSDPVSVKKLQRLLESDDDDDDVDIRLPTERMHDEDEIVEDDYDILDEQEDDEVEEEDDDFDPNMTRKASSILFQSNNIKSNLTLTNSPGNLRPMSTRSRPTTVPNEEKLINSSNEEYETSITPSELMDSHYNIRWKNHQTHILLAFESLLQNETFCDVTLICDDDDDDDNNTTGDKDKDSKDDNHFNQSLKGHGGSSGDGFLKFKAHKIVLSACSEYFQRIFAENPCKHPVIVLKDYSAWEIQALIDFMYRGEVDVTMERLASLVKSAESLQIRGLTDSLGKLGADLFKPNHPFLPKCTNNNNNNKTRSNHYQPSTTMTNSNSIGRRLDDEGFTNVNRVDTGVLNLSMDLKVQQEIELGTIRKNNSKVKSSNSNNIIRGKPQNQNQNLNLSIVETLQMHKDSFPTTTGNSGSGGGGMKATATTHLQDHHHNIRHLHNQHLNVLNHHNHNHHLLPEDQSYLNDEEGDGNQSRDTRQNLLPRRKQARPRRRSGDYIAQDQSLAQDLRKVMSSLNQSSHNQQTFDLLNLHQNLQNLQQNPAEEEDDEENNGKLEMTLSRDDPDSQYQEQQTLQNLQNQQEQSPHLDNPLHQHHHLHNHHLHQQQQQQHQDETSPTSRRAGGTVMMTRLAQRRRSSKRHNQDRDRETPTSPMNLRNTTNKRGSNGNNNNNLIENDNNGMETPAEERIIDEDEILQHHQNRVLDYTTRPSSPGRNNKKIKIRGINQGLNFPGQGHLPFLRNWSPTTLGNNSTPPPGHQRISLVKQEGDSDDGISSTADQCPSPPLSPTIDPKHFLSRHLNNQNSMAHDFNMFGLHPDHPHNLQRSNNLNLVSSLQFNKQSPPSPSNFFLGPLGSMSITPIGGRGDSGSGGGDREDSRAGTPSTPPNVFSPAGFPMQLPLALTSGNSHGGHHNHHHHGIKEERDGERVSGGRSGKDGTRGSPVGWPGLPLGPPPIFGRHRAQHSAPRGGPPRAWSNADLTEALHNVWNKKMTTSQASRIFGIPYNSLLMYVRGKYGKSLKLDLLKKGLDQAMENSANALNNSNANTNATSSPPAVSTSNNNSSSNVSNTNPSTTSPTTHNNLSITSSNNNTTPNTNSTTGGGNNNNNNNNNNTSSVKGHSNSISNHLLSSLGSEHNNNNNPATTAAGMAHLHHHLQNLHNHHHQQQQQQQQHHNSKSSNKSHDRLSGLELPHELPPGFNPFSAASIFGEYPTPFPFASALSHILPQANLQHPGLGLLNHSGRNDKVSVGDDDK